MSDLELICFMVGFMENMEQCDTQAFFVIVSFYSFRDYRTVCLWLLLFIVMVTGHKRHDTLGQYSTAELHPSLSVSH